MPRVVIFSDIHNDLAALKKAFAQDADAYFIAGDLVNWGRGLDEMGQQIASASRVSPAQIYVMPGNHESARDIETFCQQFGFTDFHGAETVISGTRFAGLGYSTPTPFDTPGEMSEDEMAAHLEKFTAAKPDVLICHAPPLYTALDQIHEGLHAGSRAVREFIEKYQPAHFFCGHIHEAEGVVIHISRTRAMNVGKRGYILDL